jgi:hypothetical protein
MKFADKRVNGWKDRFNGKTKQVIANLYTRQRNGFTLDAAERDFLSLVKQYN